MSVWVPWDANASEIFDRNVIRDRIPSSVRPALREWLRVTLEVDYGQTSESQINLLQSALHVNFNMPRGSLMTDFVVDRIEEEGDTVFLRVIDFVLSQYQRDLSWRVPPAVETLRWHLDTSNAAIRVGDEGNSFRLAQRLPDGVEEAAQIAVDAAPRLAGEHLAKALREMHGLDPDRSLVMTEAIRAVEAAAGAVVIPKDKSPQLSKIVAALKDKGSWTLALKQRDDGYPDHRAVLIGMLETLVFAQTDRHSGEAPTEAEAQGHVLLAANLVGWFSTGVVEIAE